MISHPSGAPKHIQDLNLVITVSVDVLPANSTIPSDNTILTTYTYSFKCSLATDYFFSGMTLSYQTPSQIFWCIPELLMLILRHVKSWTALTSPLLVAIASTVIHSLHFIGSASMSDIIRIICLHAKQHCRPRLCSCIQDFRNVAFHLETRNLWRMCL